MHHVHHTPEQIALLPVLLVGLIVGLLCSVLSVIVVLKRLAFIGQGISHAGFGGVGTAMVLGMAPGLMQDGVVLVFCMVAALGIGLMSRRHTLEPDSAIGIILAGAMAWGALTSSLAAHLREYAWYREMVGPAAHQPGFDEVLFGSLLGVGQGDLVLATVVAALIAALLVVFFRDMLFFAFDESAARVFGVRSGLIYGLMLLMLSLAIVVSIRLVGFLLVTALLVVPGAAGTLLSRRLARVVTIAIAVGVAGTLGGLGLSLGTGFLPPGPAMVLVLCALLAVAAGMRRVVTARG